MRPVGNRDDDGQCSSTLSLRIDFAEIYKHVNEDINIKVLLDDRFRIDADDAPFDDHYTLVRLIGLHGNYRKLANVDELRRIVSQNLPCKIDPTFEYAEHITKALHQVDGYQEFPILVEGGEVFKRFPSGLQEPKVETLKSDGEEYALCWYCTGNGSLDSPGPGISKFSSAYTKFCHWSCRNL